ncbi:MAG: ATP-binding protein [Oscillospiraceae bacterium]|mgnify:FL=1|nr:ATP-binding protein [Oscillospiraceae bacterium]
MSTMTKRIFRATLLVGVAVLIASLTLVMGALYSYFGRVQESQLRDELSLAVVGVEQNGTDYLRKLRSDQYRITWLCADGAVLYDTQADAESMENHAQRQEVQQALATGEGESSRYSDTLLQKTVYYAKRLPDGTVLRLSAIRVTTGVLVLNMLQPILLVLAAALILSGVLASRLARRITEPLNRLDLEHPLENDTYEELAPLLRRMEHQRRQIDRQMDELRRRSEEFEQITGSMNEGLVLLDEAGVILSINPAARRLLDAAENCVGQDLLTVDRDMALSDALRQAAEQGHSEFRGQRNGREYQFDVTRIQSEGRMAGTVLLVFDVTERAFAERNRREFTANVSHELKTPLQGIIGSAELLENGLVKQEDVPRFIGHIRSEAQRLVTLIGDIIRLSQLDEGEPMPAEPVELLALAREAAESLQSAAAARNVTITVEGEPVALTGVRRLLYEIVFNLCDNAIKYNTDGGRVQVTVTKENETAAVTVRDTGIGIPPDQQDRVFERFYRVDKSHSKASGGTGLGLSIVKHAVQYHHGAIHLQSEVGKGTEIRVTFPLA